MREEELKDAFPEGWMIQGMGSDHYFALAQTSSLCGQRNRRAHRGASEDTDHPCRQCEDARQKREAAASQKELGF